MKTIGILGGIGPQATMDFEQRLHRAARRIIPPYWNSGYPPLVVIYLRHPPLLVDENAKAIFPWQPDPRLLAAAAKLGAMADFLVVTSNGTHTFLPQIEQAAGKKVLSMIDSTLAEVRRRGWKRVGVLGFGDPVIYTRPLRELGIAFDTIDVLLRQELDDAIVKVMEGRLDGGPVALRAIDELRRRGSDGVILGCTEIPFLVPSSQEELDLINPLEYLAEAAVRAAM